MKNLTIDEVLVKLEAYSLEDGESKQLLNLICDYGFLGAIRYLNKLNSKQKDILLEIGGDTDWIEDIREELKELYNALCFDYKTMPETIRENVHMLTKESVNKVLDKINENY